MRNTITEIFFASGWSFSEGEVELKNKFQMINIGLLLSTAGLLFGLSANIIRHTPMLIPIETMLICVNMVLVFILRMKKFLRNCFSCYYLGVYISVFIFSLY